MKNILFYIVLLCFATVVQAQHELQHIDEFMTQDGNTDIIIDLPRGTGTELPDLTFNFNNWSSASFNLAVTNERTIRRAAERRLDAWYNRQLNEVVKPQIERKLNKGFGSFDEAKNALFSYSEIRNIRKNVEPPKAKYHNLRSTAYNKRNGHLKDIKLLKLRAAEIAAGNLNNPVYPNARVNNTLLKDLKDATRINSLLAGVVSEFEPNAANAHIYHYTHAKLKDLGSAFTTEVMNRKNDYFNGISDKFDRLNFMQFLLYYEEFKNAPIVTNIWAEGQQMLDRYKSSDIASEPFIENYAKQHRAGGISVFDIRYYHKLLNDYGFFSGAQPPYIAEAMAKKKLKELRDAALNSLLKNTSINANTSIDFLVELFKITDIHQLQWLNENPAKAIEIKTQIEGTSYQELQQVVFPTYIQPMLVEGAYYVRFLNELGIDNTNHRRFLYDHTDILEQLKTLTDENRVNRSIPADIKNTCKLTTTALVLNKINGPYDANYYNAINQYVNANLTDPYLQAVWITHFSIKCAILKKEHPNWSNFKIYWEASREMVHFALDMGGLVPVVGEIFDVTNGIIYTIEGDGTNASLSFASAIPVVGWFSAGGKYAYKLTQYTINGTRVKLVMEVLSNGFVYFGASGSKLRKALGITDAAMHAHHLIPWALRGLDIVQKAAKSKYAFHINEALNGIPRLKSLHLTGHSRYNSKISEVLATLSQRVRNNDDAFRELTDFIGYLKNLIRNNPNLNSGQIADLIQYP